MQGERRKHTHALGIYYSLGPGRSYRKVAARLECSPNTIALWAKKFDWTKQIKDWVDTGRKASEEAVTIAGNPPPPKADAGNREEQNIVNLIEQCRVLLDGCFEYDGDGNPKPTFHIKNAADFTKIANVQSELVKGWRDIQGKSIGKQLPPTKLADKLIVIFENASEDEKLGLLKGVEEKVNEGRVTGSERKVSEGNYTEVPPNPGENAK